jgi:hypothetical protein
MMRQHMSTARCAVLAAAVATTDQGMAQGPKLAVDWANHWADNTPPANPANLNQAQPPITPHTDVLLPYDPCKPQLLMPMLLLQRPLQYTTTPRAHR